MVAFSLVVSLLLVAVDAFRPTFRARGVSSLQMVLVDPETWPGQSAPFGYFDPLGLSKFNDEKQVKRWRESELKHGRLAMIAALAIPFSETFHPFWPKLEGPAIHHFDQMNEYWASFLFPFWVVPLVWTGLFEAYSIAKGWEAGVTTNAIKDNYIPGDLDFDPLGLKAATPTDFNKMSAEFRNQRTKELNNGRLAMLAVAGFVAQELVDGLPVIEHLRTFGLTRGF